jgi:membrane-associated phospholipid phosphatase
MTKRLRGNWLVITALVAAWSATAHASARDLDSPRVLPHAAHGLFTGDDWRYDRQHLVGGFALRLLADFVAIPTGAPWWSANEWLIFGGTVCSTVALSVGTPSVDVRFQNFVRMELLGGPDHFRVWNMTGDLIIWSAAFAATLATFIYGLVADDALATETAVLMAEAFVVAQLYHNIIKLLTGRAGPRRTELEGRYFGPAEGYKLWPEGTPSGHMASMYSMLSVLMHMIDHPALWVGLNAFALVFGAALVGDDYHWLSDVTFGAAIGFCVGRWIVRHRSTHFVYGVDEKPLVKLSVLPVLMPGSGAGFGVVGSF